MSGEHDDDPGAPTPEQEAQAFEALDELEADRRAALRGALATLLTQGPDALLAAESTFRDRLSDDGAHALGDVVAELHPSHPGVRWAFEYQGIDA